MSTKHTPGPWIVQGPHDAPWVCTADHKTHLPSTVADARLIAESPTLLALLTAALKWMSNLPTDDQLDRPAHRERVTGRELLVRMKQAVERANGDV
jgi:hypothetical protein